MSYDRSSMEQNLPVDEFDSQEDDFDDQLLQNAFDSWQQQSLTQAHSNVADTSLHQSTMEQQQSMHQLSSKQILEITPLFRSQETNGTTTSFDYQGNRTLTFVSRDSNGSTTTFDAQGKRINSAPINLAPNGMSVSRKETAPINLDPNGMTVSRKETAPSDHKTSSGSAREAAEAITQPGEEKIIVCPPPPERKSNKQQMIEMASNPVDSDIKQTYEVSPGKAELLRSEQDRKIVCPPPEQTKPLKGI